MWPLVVASEAALARRLHYQSRDQEYQSRPSEQPWQTVVEPEQPGARIPAHCCFRLQGAARGVGQAKRLAAPLDDDQQS
jgi:hypothetical protein